MCGFSLLTEKLRLRHDKPRENVQSALWLVVSDPGAIKVNTGGRWRIAGRIYSLNLISQA